MPIAARHKDNRMVLSQHKVRAAGQLWIVEPEAIAAPVEK
jgi:hypothetical protein